MRDYATPTEASEADFHDEQPAKPLSLVTPAGCEFRGPVAGFLGGCAQDCRAYKTLETATAACATLLQCGGVVAASASPTNQHFELRSASRLSPGEGSSTEVSYIKAFSKACGNVPIPTTTPGEFWAPPPGTDLDQVGTLVDGHPTIFLNIAAYRDEMCHLTIARALQWAEFPQRLRFLLVYSLFVFIYLKKWRIFRFGVVDQRVEGEDTPCLATERPCAEDPAQLVCKYRANIKVCSYFWLSTFIFLFKRWRISRWM
jgi:hypothetical protein